LVYNYHHGHSHIDRFDTLARTMLPYLWAVNLNGMKKGGPKIMTVGTGDHESNMTRSLRDAGYRGPFGVLGHQESKDVRVVLRRNLKGASELLNKEP
ncbi:MAG: AP endonuclease, partial [Planctomycetota bacterium]